MKHCIESTIDMEYPNQGFILRLWVGKEKLPKDFNVEESILDRFHEWLSNGLKDIHPDDFYTTYCYNAKKFERIVEYFENIPGINAVQVKEITTCQPQFGTMSYFVPF